MAIDLQYPIFYPRHISFDWGGLVDQLTMNSTNQRLMWRFPCMKAGTYDRIAWRTGTVTSAQSMQIGFQSISTTTGLPTGTWLGATNNGYATIATPATGTT